MKKNTGQLKRNYTEYCDNVSETKCIYFELFLNFNYAYEKFMAFHKFENENGLVYCCENDLGIDESFSNYINNIEVQANDSGEIELMVSKPETQEEDHFGYELKKVEE